LPDTLKTDLEGDCGNASKRIETPQSNLSALVESLPVAAPEMRWLAGKQPPFQTGLSTGDHAVDLV
jgi:hypothetical protein